MAADDLLARTPSPTAAEVLDGLGGVLCRCTGYTTIVEAVRVGRVGRARRRRRSRRPAPRSARASPAPTGWPRSPAAERFGDDLPADGAWHLRAVRSPHAHARFAIGDLAPVRARHPGLVRILTAADVPGQQPLRDLRDRQGPAGPRRRLRPLPRRGGAGARRRRGDRRRDRRRRAADRPGSRCRRCSASTPRSTRRRPGSTRPRPGNVLIEGLRPRGATSTATSPAPPRPRPGRSRPPTSSTRTSSPRRGRARVVDGRVEVFATTQTPYMDRDELALILGLPEDRVRVIPSACGGGFGGKLDLSLQPLIAIAALPARPPGPRASIRGRSRWPRRPSATRPGSRPRSAPTRTAGSPASASTATSTPAPTRRGARRSPTASRSTRWARTRSARCSSTSRAVYTNGPPAGAFRGFGVPQAAIAHEALMDDLAEQLGIDPLEFRARNALRAGSRTATSQELVASAGLPACLDALRPRWTAMRAEAAAVNEAARGPGPPRRRDRRPCGTASATRRSPTRPRSRSASAPTAPSSCSPARPTSARARTRSSPRSPPTPSACRSRRSSASAPTPTSPPTPARPRRRARRSCRGTRPGSPPRTCAASS